MGTYKVVRRCVACKHKMESHDIAYSQGVCPKCGKRSDKSHRGPVGHHLVEVAESVEYVPSLFERLFKRRS